MPKQIRPNPKNKAGLHERLNSLVFFAVLLLVVLSPIPYGSNRAWSWSLCALLIAVLSLVWVVNALSDQRNVSLSLPASVITLFLIPVFWVLLQVSSSVPDAWAHPLWGLADEAMDVSLPSMVSLTPDESITALMRLISYALVFFLVFQFCRNPHRAHTTLKWLAIAGILYALFGLVVFWGDIHVFFWTDASGSINSVRSTFINKNAYVNYAGLGLICLMALSLSNLAREHRPQLEHLRGRQERFEAHFMRIWKPLLGLMLITTALVSTQSRGGAIACAIGVFTFLLIYLIRKKPTMKTLFSSLGAISLIILLAYLASNEVLLQRMTKVESEGAERFIVFGLTIDATKDSPLTGFGYGAFDQAFKTYRDENVQYIYDKTHNTYLENIFELGVPAAFALFFCLLGLFLISLRGVFRRQRNWIYPATGVAATALVASHSLVDFALQIPAVAITYSAIMGLAVAQSYTGARQHS